MLKRIFTLTQIHTSVLVFVLECGEKDTVSAKGVEYKRESVKGFGIDKLRDKDTICLYY